MAQGRSPLHGTRIHRSSPRVRNHDSPSRQLQLDLEHTFAEIQLHESERHKLHAYDRKSVQDELDAREISQAIAHQTEIEAAIAQHEHVRQQAVAVLEAHINEERKEQERQQQEERRRREEEARRKAEEESRRIEKERARRAKEEKEQAEALERAAVEKATADEQRRKQAEREATVEQERQARVKAEVEAAAAQLQEEAAKATRAAAEKSLPAEVELSSVPGDEPTWSAAPEIRHPHYLSIHRRLKTFRKDFWEKSRKDPQLKPLVGDMRRVIKTSIGQLTTDDKKANSLAMRKVKDVLLKAVNHIPSPPVILNDYLPPHLSLLDKNTTTIPSLVLYLLSMFTKAVVSAFVNECAINIKTAEPIGTMVAQVFSMTELQFKRNAPSPNSGLHYTAFGGTVPTPPLQPKSVSLISIFMSKIHKVAPPLFGISGGLSEKTTSGRERLGWRKDANGSHVDESIHHSRMAGIGAGYAAVALRNFSRTALVNPWPPHHFWESLSYLVNTNPADIQPTHCYLLKSMLEINLERFLTFFGDEGIAALRTAFIDFPKRLPAHLRETNADYAVRYMADTWKKEKNFTL